MPRRMDAHKEIMAFLVISLKTSEYCFTFEVVIQIAQTPLLTELPIFTIATSKLKLEGVAWQIVTPREGVRALQNVLWIHLLL